MGLGNKAQATILSVSAFLLALGTASATIPDFMPEDIKIPLAVMFWFCGILGFALKEALGSSYETP